ncbi:hypothetical protein [Streptacidiphilus cavernicola]|uniref:Gram-positive cocci surface proteins LPxTG domain-containing protein n=1 Tax=Streptacidiphilus cavernicola TaxID=3342716 RepID=A0ABV6VUA7_9ACTN
MRRGIGLGLAGLALTPAALLAAPAQAAAPRAPDPGSIAAPVPAAPTTAAPVTEAPAIAALTAAAPATAALATAAPVTAAPVAALAGPAPAPSAVVCGRDVAGIGRPPLGLGFSGLRASYDLGGDWSGFTLRAGNATPAACPGVLPVVVFGAQGTALRTGDLQVQWRDGGGAWQRTALVAEDGLLVGLVGPARGLTLPSGSTRLLPMRMRFAGGAPTGQWVTMAIGYEPVALDGQTVPLPVGVSDPHLFRVVPRPSADAQLARTGGSPATAAAAAGSAALLGGGAGLLLLARLTRRRSARR